MDQHFGGIYIGGKCIQIILIKAFPDIPAIGTHVKVCILPPIRVKQWQFAPTICARFPLK